MDAADITFINGLTTDFEIISGKQRVQLRPSFSLYDTLLVEMHKIGPMFFISHIRMKKSDSTDTVSSKSVVIPVASDHKESNRFS